MEHKNATKKPMMVAYIISSTKSKIMSVNQTRRRASDPQSDDMENNWGCTFASAFSGITSPTYSSLCDKLRIAVPGFQLVENGLCLSGTHANLRAMDLAFGSNRDRCLFAMGSYVGGLECVEKFATNTCIDAYDKRLCMVKDPKAVSSECLQATVPFPYYIPNETVNMTEVAASEAICLEFIEKKLLVGILTGAPFKALLMEYILTGNGGQLSDTFKTNLGNLLRKYSVSIIADEIMTGGRVGPGLALTLSQPASLQERVKYITLGKIFDCGVTLESISVEKDQGARQPARGTSTELETTQAYRVLSNIVESYQGDLIQSTQAKFFNAFDLNPNDSNHVWGLGLLLFSSRSRCKVRHGLRNRYLPQIGASKKLRKGSVTQSEYTSTWVNKKLMESTAEWNRVLGDHLAEAQHPFLVAVCDYILKKNNSSACDIYVSELLDYYSERQQEEMLQKHKKRKVELLGSKRGRCSKSPSSVFSDILTKAADSSNGYLVRCVKTKKRRICFSLASIISPT